MTDRLKTRLATFAGAIGLILSAVILIVIWAVEHAAGAVTKRTAAGATGSQFRVRQLASAAVSSNKHHPARHA